MSMFSEIVYEQVAKDLRQLASDAQIEDLPREVIINRLLKLIREYEAYDDV